MILLRTLTRLVGVVLTLVLALGGLALALYCLDGAIPLGSARPDRLLALESVRRHVGHFLGQLAARGSVAGLALLCGLGAMAIGLLLVVGELVPSRERQAVLEDDADAGRLSARRGVLGSLARTLAEQTPGATSIARPRVRLSRRGTRGRLSVKATRSRTADPRAVRDALSRELAPVTDSFHLRPRVRVRLGEPGERVQ